MGIEIYPVAYNNTTTVAGSYLEIALPVVAKCDYTCLDFYVNLCDKVWNCLKTFRGADHKYSNPIPLNATLFFQFGIRDFFSADPENPDLGWDDWINVEVYDFDNNLITNTLAQIATQYNNIWTGSKNVQTILIDTSLFPGSPDCFRFRFTTTAGVEYCSEDFHTVLDCTNILEVEGVYETFDCCENYYGTGVGVGDLDLVYRNRTWIPATFKESAYNSEREELSSVVVSSVEVKTVFDLILNKVIPPYLNRVIWKQIFGAKSILIAGEPWKLETTEARKRSLSGSMFYWAPIEFSTLCKSEC